MAGYGEKRCQGCACNEVGLCGGEDRLPWKRNLGDRNSMGKGWAQDGADHYGGGSFQSVEQKCQDAECGRLAGYVGGADVTAAAAADVFAAEDADEEIAEGDGAQEVAGGRD